MAAAPPCLASVRPRPCSRLQPGRCGARQVVKVGRIVATINADIRMVDGGRLVAQARHTKFLPPDEKEVQGLPRARL